MITGSYVMMTWKPLKFSEEDPWSVVESSKFRPMFAGVNMGFHLYVPDTLSQKAGNFGVGRCLKILRADRLWGRFTSVFTSAGVYPDPKSDRCIFIQKMGAIRP